MAEDPRSWARREIAAIVVLRQDLPTQPTVVETGQDGSTWLIAVICPKLDQPPLEDSAFTPGAACAIGFES